MWWHAELLSRPIHSTPPPSSWSFSQRPTGVFYWESVGQAGLPGHQPSRVPWHFHLLPPFGSWRRRTAPSVSERMRNGYAARPLASTRIRRFWGCSFSRCLFGGRGRPFSSSGCAGKRKVGLKGLSRRVWPGAEGNSPHLSHHCQRGGSYVNFDNGLNGCRYNPGACILLLRFNSLWIYKFFTAL